MSFKPTIFRPFWYVYACFGLGTAFAQPAQLSQPVPPSPSTKEFEKYINFPVSLFSGVPEISIPLYEINVNGLTIPLALTYHASGIKYQQTSGDVGVGWSLSPGYRVSRTIFGRKDEQFEKPSIPNLETIGTPAERDSYLARFVKFSGQPPNASGPFVDGEYDIFNFGTLGNSGSFIIEDRQAKKVAILNGDRSKIEYDTYEPIYEYKQINTFNITDPNGIKYRFGTDNAGQRNGCEYPPVGDELDPEGGPTAWLVTEMTTPFNDVVRFTYETRSEFLPISFSFTLQEAVVGFPQSPCIPAGYSSSASGSYYYNVPFLKEISTPTETIRFTRPNSTDPIIKSIEIRDKQENLIRRIEFTHKSGNASGLYGFYTLLDKVSIYGEGAEPPQVFRCEYNAVMGSSEYAQDYWGYICPSSSSVGMFQLPPELGMIGVDVNIGCSSLWATTASDVATSLGGPYGIPLFNGRTVVTAPVYNTLSKIIYPTGGYTTYDYESNEYKNNNGVVEKGAGLRISAIRMYDVGNPIAALSRVYKYGIGENGVGIATLPPRADYLVSESMVFEPPQSDPLVVGRWLLNFNMSYSSEAFSDAASGVPVYYPEVNVYHNEGRERYIYSSSGVGNAYQAFRNNPRFVGTAIPAGQGVNLHEHRRRPNYFVLEYYFYKKEPQLLFREVYDKGKNILQRESYKYGQYRTRTFSGLKVRRYAFDKIDHVFDFYTVYGLGSFFDYSTYNIFSGYSPLTDKETTQYKDGKAFSIVEKYWYNQYFQLKRDSIGDSERISRISEYTYPLDYTELTAANAVPAPDSLTAAIGNLQSRNIVEPVIEKRQIKRDAEGNRSVVSSTMNIYHPSLPVPKRILGTEATTVMTDFVNSRVENGTVVIDQAHYKPQVHFKVYGAKGNIMQQNKQGDMAVSYIWGYDPTLPIAEVKNSALVNLAYTSFEVGAPGEGWTYVYGSGTPRLDSKTGSQVYYLGDGRSLSKGDLMPGTYRLTYWANGGVPELFLGTGVSVEAVTESKPDAKGWILYDKKIVVAAGSVGNIRIEGSVTVALDEVRFHPADAMMTTYTYDRSGNITSTSDAGCLTTYFEYDGFQRLNLVKDHAGNITREYIYRYRATTN